MQTQAYYLCRHIVFSCMMYNEICQYSSSSPNDPSLSLTLYGTVPINRSFPYSLMNENSGNELITFDQLKTDQLLNQCREQCFHESKKAMEILQTDFDQKSSATKLLRSIIQQIQDGLSSKTVI